MGVDYSTLIYLPNFEIWARTVTFTPVISQPTGAAFVSRGIFHSEELMIQGEDGSVITDQRTTLDILEAEFGAIPQQGDLVTIPADVGAMRALGDFEVINVWQNGGGETTLTLRKIMTAP